MRKYNRAVQAKGEKRESISEPAFRGTSSSRCGGRELTGWKFNDKHSRVLWIRRSVNVYSAKRVRVHAGHVTDDRNALLQLADHCRLQYRCLVLRMVAFADDDTQLLGTEASRVTKGFPNLRIGLFHGESVNVDLMRSRVQVMCWSHTSSGARNH